MSEGHWKFLTQEDVFQRILHYIMFFFWNVIPCLADEDIIPDSVWTFLNFRYKCSSSSFSLLAFNKNVLALVLLAG